MIQHAFTGAYTSEISSKNQGINTLASSAKDVGVLALGAMGFSGDLGTGAIAQGAKHALAGRVGGIGGNIMLATMKQKKDSAQVNQATKSMFTAEEVGNTIQAQLGDNPINRSAIKKLNTVFDTLISAKEEGMINKKGQIESSIGEIDPNSELGKKILSNLDKEDKK